MFCQCGGTGKGIKSKVGGELDISLQALFTYLCDLCAFECAISPLILLFQHIELHFIKNGNPNLVNKMPIQDLKAWARDLNMVVIMLEDSWKKQLVGLICSIQHNECIKLVW
jgi:hypothetical protein